MDRCKVERPLLRDAGSLHQVACLLNEGTGTTADAAVVAAKARPHTA
jgi:peptide/nickel transport system ATP-binding protein/oligopeptide transport system ATP-binding protein